MFFQLIHPLGPLIGWNLRGGKNASFLLMISKSPEDRGEWSCSHDQEENERNSGRHREEEYNKESAILFGETRADGPHGIDVCSKLQLDEVDVRSIMTGP